MDQEREERFSKRARLRKRNEYLLVQRSGKKIHSKAFLGLVLSNDARASRLGITTSKRLGNAVQRNRLRRLIREAFRRGWMPVPSGIDLVVIAKKPAAGMDNQAIFDDLGGLGRRLGQLREAGA